jgi:hypothetical protein
MHLHTELLVSLDPTVSLIAQRSVQRINEHWHSVSGPDFGEGLRCMRGNSVGPRCCGLKQSRNPGSTELGECVCRVPARVELSSLQDGSKSTDGIFWANSQPSDGVSGRSSNSVVRIVKQPQQRVDKTLS